MIIVVSVVRSPVGDRALALAELEAVARRAKLILVGTAIVDDETGEEVAALREYLDETEERLRERGVVCSSEWAVGHSQSSALIGAAVSHEADLIVLGLRRRSAVGKLILGSYEQEVLLDAPCPVLSVVEPLRS